MRLTTFIVEFAVADIAALTFGEAVDEDTDLLCPIGNDRAETAGTPRTGGASLKPKAFRRCSGKTITGLL
jgi:hypothetical protein